MCLKNKNNQLNKFKDITDDYREFKNIRKDINKEIKEFEACIDKYTSIEYYYHKNEWEIYHLC